ncbi:hypothetical protein GGI11_003406, partial [Coemansia sp. RSA 2049]
MTDHILAALERDYLLPRPAIANPQLSAAQTEVPLRHRLHDVLTLGPPRSETTVAMTRDPVTGEYCAATTTAKATQMSSGTHGDPMSFARAAGRPQDYATGSASQLPFRPGGLDASESAIDAEQ